MASGPSRQCPDCAVPLEHIKLLDRNYRSIEDGLFYTTHSAKRRLWDGNYTEAHQIQGFICPQCGRLLLYGETSQTRLPIPSEEAEPDASALPRPGSADG
jgi:hypothetical protein